MTKFANGRGNPSALDQDWNRNKANRSLVLDETFARFGKWSWLGSGTIFARTNAKRQAYRDERERVYRELVAPLEHEPASAEEWGLIYMDGDGTDQIYRRAHRDLQVKGRRIGF